MTVSKRDKEIWRVALTLAHNICIQQSDRHNADDQSEEAQATSYCASRIRDWLEPSGEQLDEMLDEGGVQPQGQPAWLCEALNTGDGTYRP